MEIIRGYHNLRERHRGCVLTIGNFDGVHRGHQVLIARARELARQQGVPLVVFTFEPMPREFFSPQAAPGRISTFRGRVALLAGQGVDRVVLQRFDRAFAGLEAADFIARVLVAGLGVRAVVVGDDFRFGARRAGDLALLQALGRRHGFAAEGLGTVAYRGERCSSTALRQALAAADMAHARQLLGHPYTLCGHVRRGLQLGRKLGMPTANITIHRPLALKQGVYVVRARAQGRSWEGVASLGVRPTLGLTRCLLETHLFGDPGNLYHAIMEVEFCRYLRAEQRFDSLDALAAQMQRDAEAAKAFFRENPA